VHRFLAIELLVRREWTEADLMDGMVMQSSKGTVPPDFFSGFFSSIYSTWGVDFEAKRI
jgi:hypothetical protein